MKPALNIDIALDQANATFYRLTGEYQWSAELLGDRARWSSFRETPIVSELILDCEGKSDALNILSNSDSFGGEPMRCFIPRHGLRLSTGSQNVDLLICLECYIIKSWVDDKEDSHIISVNTALKLNEIFTDKPTK